MEIRLCFLISGFDKIATLLDIQTIIIPIKTEIKNKIIIMLFIERTGNVRHTLSVN